MKAESYPVEMMIDHEIWGYPILRQVQIWWTSGEIFYCAIWGRCRNHIYIYNKITTIIVITIIIVKIYNHNNHIQLCLLLLLSLLLEFSSFVLTSCRTVGFLNLWQTHALNWMKHPRHMVWRLRRRLQDSQQPNGKARTALWAQKFRLSFKLFNGPSTTPSYGWKAIGGASEAQRCTICKTLASKRNEGNCAKPSSK